MATVRSPISLQAQMTRSAISPRLAMRTLRMADGPESEELLSVFDRLAILHEALHDLAGTVALDLVHQLHGFDDTEHLSCLDVVADFDEGGRTRRWRFIECTNDWRLHDVQRFLFRLSRWCCCLRSPWLCRRYST